MQGKPSTPDYRLTFSGADLFFDVKEFDAPLPSPGFNQFWRSIPPEPRELRLHRPRRRHRDAQRSVSLAGPQARSAKPSLRKICSTPPSACSRPAPNLLATDESPVGDAHLKELCVGAARMPDAAIRKMTLPNGHEFTTVRTSWIRDPR